ncbi:hypothetical protein LTR08_000330 [Meristemomyces frigidus]|nr:hypothetical protein LTR08_000330 [Meristemomyces frigidus]
MRGFMYRICLTVINIFFPPLAVAMLCGLDHDCLVNCFLFLLAVIPAHVHGFYISCTYFHRRHKVKKGRWPGGAKSMIRSRNVINGGASNAEVDALWRKENGLERESSGMDSAKQGDSPRQEKHGSNMHRHNSRQQQDMVQRQDGQLGRTGTNHSRRHEAARTRTEERMARHGLGYT